MLCALDGRLNERTGIINPKSKLWGAHGEAILKYSNRGTEPSQPYARRDHPSMRDRLLGELIDSIVPVVQSDKAALFARED